MCAAGLLAALLRLLLLLLGLWLTSSFWCFLSSRCCLKASLTSFSRAFVSASLSAGESGQAAHQADLSGREQGCSRSSSCPTFMLLRLLLVVKPLIYKSLKLFHVLAAFVDELDVSLAVQLRFDTRDLLDVCNEAQNARWYWERRRCYGISEDLMARRQGTRALTRRMRTHPSGLAA